MEVLVQWFTDNLSQHISRELIIFIISMIPILELRGGLLAASLLKVSAAKAIPIPNIQSGKYALCWARFYCPAGQT